jgi:hypothetical protein
MINVLEKFAKANEEYIHYWWVNDFFKSYRNEKEKVTSTPEVYGREFRKLMNLHGIGKGYHIIEKDTLDFRVMGRFYLDITPEGYVKEIDSRDLQDCLWPEFISQMIYVKEKTERQFDETTRYARAFETKKHINKSHLERMSNNAFLFRFGTVEIDNDVDLDKFTLLERDFEEYVKMVYVPLCKDHSFRIKKLGVFGK